MLLYLLRPLRNVLKSRKFGQSTTRARPSRSPKPRNAKLGQPFAVRPAGGSWLGAIQAPSRFTDTRDGVMGAAPIQRYTLYNLYNTPLGAMSRPAPASPLLNTPGT